VGGLTGGLIAPFQGFWVQSTDASAQLTFTNAAKTTGATFRGKETNVEKVRLSVTHQNGGRNDAFLHFSENGKVGFDSWDGWKLRPFTSNYILLSSGYINGFGLDINHLPLLSGTLEIPFGLETTLNGTYSLRLENGLSSEVRFEVIDTETGRRAALGADGVFTFEVTKAAKAAPSEPGKAPIQVQSSSPRFVLVISRANATSNEGSVRVTELALEQNYPNPFNPSTAIRFSLPQSGNVRLGVYDVNGRLIEQLVNSAMTQGNHTVRWNAAGQASGVYMLRLEASGQTLTRKMTFLK
jgi:hypothetical protein